MGYSQAVHCQRDGILCQKKIFGDLLLLLVLPFENVVTPPLSLLIWSCCCLFSFTLCACIFLHECNVISEISGFDLVKTFFSYIVPFKKLVDSLCTLQYLITSDRLLQFLDETECGFKCFSVWALRCFLTKRVSFTLEFISDYWEF